MARYPGISQPRPDVSSLHNTVLELKEAIEILTRQRKSSHAGAITWQDLLDLQLIEKDVVPGDQV